MVEFRPGAMLAVAAAMHLALATAPASAQQTFASNTKSVTGFAVSGMYVLIEQGQVTIRANAGTFGIDSAGQVDCVSASGCTIVATPDLTFIGRPYAGPGCPIVDGQVSNRSCKNGFPSAFTVAQGTHTVQTEIIFSGGNGRKDYISYFDTYTVYDH